MIIEKLRNLRGESIARRRMEKLFIFFLSFVRSFVCFIVVGRLSKTTLSAWAPARQHRLEVRSEDERNNLIEKLKTKERKRKENNENNNKGKGRPACKYSSNVSFNFWFVSCTRTVDEELQIYFKKKRMKLTMDVDQEVEVMLIVFLVTFLKNILQPSFITIRSDSVPSSYTCPTSYAIDYTSLSLTLFSIPSFYNIRPPPSPSIAFTLSLC